MDQVRLSLRSQGVGSSVALNLRTFAISQYGSPANPLDPLERSLSMSLKRAATPHMQFANIAESVPSLALAMVDSRLRKGK